MYSSKLMSDEWRATHFIMTELLPQGTNPFDIRVQNGNTSFVIYTDTLRCKDKPVEADIPRAIQLASRVSPAFIANETRMQQELGGASRERTDQFRQLQSMRIALFSGRCP